MNLLELFEKGLSFRDGAGTSIQGRISLIAKLLN